jgi:hypothetical protein
MFGYVFAACELGIRMFVVNAIGNRNNITHIHSHSPTLKEHDMWTDLQAIPGQNSTDLVCYYCCCCKKTIVISAHESSLHTQQYIIIHPFGQQITSG